MELIASKKNPIISGKGVCDPHIHIFDDKAFLYATHDDSPDNSNFVMRNWEIWSSTDLVKWQKESVIKPEDTYMGTSACCWATDAAVKNSNYYFYFSNGMDDTGVMSSNNPSGPFKKCDYSTVLPKNLTPTKQYDPAVFVDDDENKTPYIIFGTPIWAGGDSYYIAKLHDNMISIAETPKKIIVDDTADDKPFVHKHKGVYYLSWASYYAISDNIYGPYRLIGNFGASADHGSFFEWNNQWFNAFTIFDPTVFLCSMFI